MKHFRLLGSVDVAPVVALLPALASYWPRDTLRQDAPGTPHVDTESIYLRMPPVVDERTIFTSMELAYREPMPNYTLWELSNRVGQLASQITARVMLVKLKGGGVIAPHIDQGAYAEATDRYHVAIVSNPACLMHIGDEAVAAKPGEVWWFDKHTVHAVVNKGADRVHLIVDTWRV